jgi:polysaccharide export outer membrane protein
MAFGGSHYFMQRGFRYLLPVLAMCLAPFSMAGQQTPAAQPDVTKPAAETKPADTTVKDPAVGVGVDIHKYLIGPEDVLFIRVWREPDFTGPQIVRPDGNITLPLIGEIHAGGLTPVALGDALHEQLAKLINNPDVSVSQVNSKKYYIDGEVFRPGEYKLITPTRVLAALSQAGGFRDFANTKKIRILRGSETFKFNYKDVSHGKHMEQNIFLENGDHIIVP